MRSFLLVFGSFFFGGMAPISHATTFTVNNTANSGAGSLRQAVLDANATAGADTIAFAIAGDGPHEIRLSSAALSPNGPLLIDGYTQPGAQPNTLAPQQGGLNGVLKILVAPATLSPASSGLVIDSGEVRVRGLVVSGFGQSGSVIVSGNATVARIEGCYIGTDASGNAPFNPASVRGISVQGGRLHLGGTMPAQRNLLSGHSNDALQLLPSTAENSTIEGNLFGTAANGTSAIGNGSASGGHAIRGTSQGVFTMRNLLIGGNTAAARNLFSAGAAAAIRFDCAALLNCLDGLLIQGNFIGTDISGSLPLPNNANCPPIGCGGGRIGGIDISGLSLGAITIGDATSGAGNRIAFNHGAGVGWQVTAGSVVGSMEILGNEFLNNGGLGIELIRNSVSAVNDAGDVDEGANRFQNAPVVESAVIVSGGTQLQLSYRVDTAISSASYPLRVDFYRSGDGEEGAEFLGSDSYVTAFAQVSKTTVLTLPAGISGLPVVAVATDADRHSSKFSNVLGDLIFSDGFEL